MKKGIKVFAIALLAIVAVSCGSVTKMLDNANKVQISCQPEVLQAVAGEVKADITINFPEKYFYSDAILTVTPVLVYEGGEVAGKPFKYQGIDVKDNYKVISKKGQKVTETVSFVFVPGMEKCRLELRSVATDGKKVCNLPVVKVADGCNTTYMLAQTNGFLNYKPDGYQAVVKQTEEGQILYQINSSVVSNKQLKSSSIKEFKSALKEINSNHRKILRSTEVVAYASPDGKEKLNDKLSSSRAKTADKAWNKVVAGKYIVSPSVKSMGEDWSGFNDLVANSNIPDKDLIIRVLSMYNDPAVREREIRNLSEVFTALKSTILPQLRRARFIANVEYINYNAKELLSLVEDNMSVLDESALLKAATLVKSDDLKETIYKTAIDKFGSDKAQFNLGVLYVEKGELQKAKEAFASVKTQDDELTNALGVCEMLSKNYDKAKSLFRRSETKEAKLNMGILYLVQGQYKYAAEVLKGSGTASEGVALILIDQPEKAISAVKCGCPKAYYVKAVAAARINDSKSVAKYLGEASACPKMKARIANDIEFSKYNVVVK